MGRFTEKQLTIMTIVVAVIITGLFAALIYRDLRTIEEEDEKMTATTMNIRSAEAEIQKFPQRETDVIVFREIVKRDSAILPDASEINKFINIIGEFEKFSGVVVTSVQGLSGRSRGKKSKEAILKIPMKIKLMGSMDQLLKFINLFENYDRFVSVSGITLGAGGAGRDKNGNVQHDINLQLETFRYNPGGGPVTKVDIPNYERRKQELAIQKRIRQSKPAHIADYNLKPRISRRDPMLDPREEDKPIDDDETPLEQRYKEGRALLDKLILDVTLLEDDVRLEEQLRANKEYVRIAAVGNAIDQRISQLDFQISTVISERQISIPELKDEFLEKVVRPYEELKESRKTVRTPEVLVTRSQVSETLQKMRGKFETQEYREVMKIHEGFMRFCEGRKADPEAEPLLVEMTNLAEEAEVISKFQAERLRIEGTIIDPGGVSYAIINGQILAEGDWVDTDMKIRVAEIKSDSILFEYHRVPIRKSLSGK